MSHCRPDQPIARLRLVPDERSTNVQLPRHHPRRHARRLRRGPHRRSARVRQGRRPGVKGRAASARKSSTAKLKLSREDRGIEVEFEVDQNRNGVPWKVTLRRNGSLVASTTHDTRAPSGSFSVRRVISGARQRSSPLRRAPPASAAPRRPPSKPRFSLPSPAGGRRQPTVRLAPADTGSPSGSAKRGSPEPRQSRVTTLSGARRYLKAA